jgi:hypothetical protein
LEEIEDSEYDESSITEAAVVQPTKKGKKK